MRYTEFRDAIHNELRRVPSGLTWAALKKRLELPYSIPCPEWVKQMEQEVGLVRAEPSHGSWRRQPPGDRNGRSERRLPQNAANSAVIRCINAHDAIPEGK